MSDSTQRPKVRKQLKVSKPKRPYAKFPLGPHSTGKWCKRINGKLCYFGRWAKIKDGKLERVPGDGWEEALKLYNAQAEDLHAGRKPRSKADENELTVGALCNRFHNAKKSLVESGEITARTFAEYKATTDRLVKAFGPGRVVSDLRPADFGSLRAKLTKQYGPVRLGNEIQKARTVFKFAFDNALIDRPVLFGSDFAKPSKAVLRKHRARNGSKMFDAAEVRRVLDYLAGQEVTLPSAEGDDESKKVVGSRDALMTAAVLLGINAGFGQTDCASLPFSAVSLDKGVIDFPRPKTGIPRRIPLWPETVEAIKAAIAERPTPKVEADAELVLLSPTGLRCVRERGDTKVDAIGIEFARVLKTLKLHRKGIGFYTLRHVFRTVADEARDQVAANAIMGHSDPTMAGVYRERISDDRLRAVTDHVRIWLYPAEAEALRSAG